MRPIAIIAVFLGLAPPLAVAQKPASCVIDSLLRTRQFTLYLSLATPDSVPAAQKRSYQAVALTLASQMHQPPSLSLPGWPGTVLPFDDQAGDALSPWFGLGGYLTLELRRDGHLKRSRLRATSGSTELAAALEAAVLLADSAPGFPAMIDSAYPRDGRFLFRLEEAKTPTVGAVAVAQARLRALVVESPPVMIHAGVPRYPVAALSGRPVEGHAHFQFVIQPDGHPDPTSFVLLETNYREFADATYRALLDTSYEPARVGACPVPVLVHQRARFRLRR